MSIFLIRHGETAFNAARILQTPEAPLSERGVRQVERLARRLADVGITRIWSSDLARAMMTAQPLQQATGAEIVFDAELQERNYGDVRGRPYAELGVDILDPDYEPPGGETWAQFHLRVDGLWMRVVEAVDRLPGHLAIVTHGLVCYSLALRHLRLPQAVTHPLRWHNASLTEIDGSPPWTVRLLNCTAHLGDDER